MLKDLKDSLALLELTAPQDNVGTLELKVCHFETWMIFSLQIR